MTAEMAEMAEKPRVAENAGDPTSDQASDVGCHILHVDMDAFFASVEVRRCPELRGRPVIVGGLGPRGVVSSASYEARAVGVRSAMPIGRARLLCPHGVFLPPNMADYAKFSADVMEIFREFTPLVEPLSVDEAFLDVAGAARLFGSPRQIGAAIRQVIRQRLDLTCSVGVSSTKFVAKLASDRAKPDGLVVVPAQQTLAFLHPLPVSALWGVGERSAQQLARLGISTVGELAQVPVRTLRQALGDAAAIHLHELAWGADPRRVTTSRIEKSISTETTFDVDIADQDQIRRCLLDLSTRVAVRLRAAGLAGRTVGIKVRLADFRTLTRSRTQHEPTDVAREIFEAAWPMFQALKSGERIRLLGVRVEGLADAEAGPRQPTLDAREHSWRDAERAVDAATRRFGGTPVRPASLTRRRQSSE